MMSSSFAGCLCFIFIVTAAATAASKGDVKSTTSSNIQVKCPSSSSSYDINGGRSYENTDDALTTSHTSWSPEYDGSFMSLSSCDETDENAHGSYSTNLAPCEIAFHKSNDGATDDVANSFHLLSATACRVNNRVALSGTKTKSLLQYLSYWKDECVGDVTRCYSLANNQDIYLALVCRKKWTIPAEATHMSVNCTKDKQLKLAKIAEVKNRYSNENDKKDPYMALQEKTLESQNKRWHEMEALMAFVLSVLVLSCFGFAIVAYWCMIKPYMTYSRSAKRSELEDFIHNSHDDDEDAHELGFKKSAQVA